jgi:hypothetical protein
VIFTTKPPYFVFKFHKQLLTLFKGGKQDALVKRTLAWIKEGGDFLAEPSEHVSDDSALPEPFALQSLFQALGLCGFLPRMESF